MSKAQHTPGPWKTDGFKVVSRDGYQICRVDLNGGSNGFDSTNADLIASAPDLLKERDELKEQLKAAKVAFDKEVTQYDKEWSSHKATQSINAELLEALKDVMASKSIMMKLKPSDIECNEIQATFKRTSQAIAKADEMKGAFKVC